MKQIDPKAKKSALVVMAVVAGMLLVGIVFFMLMKNNVSPEKASAKIPSADAMQEEGNSGSTPQMEGYSDKSKKLDADKADKAKASGESYIPAFAPSPTDVAPASAPVAAATLNQNPYAAYNQPQQQAAPDTSSANKKIEDRMKRIEQLSATFMTEGYAPVKDSSWAPPTAAAGGAAAIANGMGLAPQNAIDTGTMIIKSGEKVFVSIDTAINTDEQSPVLATILSGKARGWVMFGATRQNPNNTISVEFTRVALPSGKSVTVSAFAIDPETGRTAVHGSVDHKIFERFVLPAIAAGLNSYGQIVSQQGKQQTTAPMTGATTVTQNMTAQQIRAASIGAGAGSIAGALSAGAQTQKAAVSTERNLGIEVVFMQELIVPKQ